MILVETNVLFALSLTVMAGLATGIGSIIALFAKTTNTKFLAGSLGFSAGVMKFFRSHAHISRQLQMTLWDIISR